MKLRLLCLPLLLIAFALEAQTPVINWTKKNGPLGGEILDIEIDPATNYIFLIDGSRRPFISKDSGNTWEQLTFTGSDNGFNDIEITNNTIFLVGSYNLFASVDGGVSFQERMTNVSPYSDAYRLKRMPTSGDLVVLAYGAIYTSSNNGQTWTLRNSTLGNVDRRYLQVNAVDQIFVLNQNASFEVRPFRSTNGGVSFTETSTGIPAGHQVHGLYAENNGGKVYAITTQDLFSSTNGTSWTSVKTAEMTDLNICDYGNLQNSFIEFSADGLGMFFVDNVNHKLYSKTLVDVNWALQATDFPSGTLSALCATAKDYPTATTATAFFGSQSGVFKTTTGGASVSENNMGLASVAGEQIIADNNNNLYLKTASVGVLKSIDQGNSWANVSTLTSSLNYFFNSPNGYNLYALATDNVLHRSWDQGTTWNPVSPAGGFVWAGAADADKVFGIANTSYPISLFYSADNANNWTASAVVVTGLPAQFSLYESSTCFASANRMFVYIDDYGTSAYAYYRIDFTYDAGNAITAATATKITTLPIPLNDIYKVKAANGKIYVYQTYGVSSDRLAVSSDGGVNWTTYTVPQSNDFFVLKNGYILLSDNSNPNKLYLSRDDGATFVETTVPAAVNLYNLKDATLDNEGFAYLAFNGDYLYQSASTIVLPSTPTSLEQAGYTATAAALRWVDSNSYDRDIIIERSLNGVDFTIAGQVSGWNVCYGSGNRGYFVDSNLLPSTTYTYRVKAKNAAGESSPSTTISFTTPAACSQTIPENRSWSAINSGTESYALLGSPVNVGIKHLGGGKYEISDLSLSLTGTSQKWTFYESCGNTLVGKPGEINPNGLGTWNGTTLTIKWRACFDDKTETISLTLNPTDPIPAKPLALYAYVISNTSTEIKWPASYYEKTYILERSSVSASSGFSQIASVPFPQTTYTDNGPLTEGTTYYYRLKALNGNGTPDPSPYSDVVSVPFKKPNFIVANNAITTYNASATIGSFWADFNNDGLEDYFTMQYDDVNQLAKPMIFKNLGSGNYEQTLITLGDGAYFLPSVADYDNDHFPDIAFNGDQARLLDIFKGNGDFTFTKVPSGQLGDLAVIEKTISYTSWADINNDGLADLMILNDEDGSYTLYKQNSNHSFTKIIQSPPTTNESLLSVWADYNNDGYQDVFINNLNGPGELYQNNSNETFTKITGNGLDAANFFSAAWGDYNNDGNIDLFCGTTTLNALYKNNGDGTFTKDASTLISEANFATSASWGDYNNDGYLDLMAVSIAFNASQSRLFLRDPSVTGSVSFKKITTEKINDLSVSHYTVANADPDQNGLLDLEMSAFIFEDSGDGLQAANSNFYQNNNLPGNWVEVKLNPAAGKSTEALGARITVNAGGNTQTREIAALSSLVSRNSLIAHFGLGSATSITNIQVKWPNGSVQNYPLAPVNQIVVIDEDLQGPAITSKTPAHTATLVEPNTTITVVFDENSFAVSGKTITVRKTGTTTAIATIDVTTGTKTGNQYVFSLPVTLDGETEYSVLMDAGAFRDRYANPSAAISAGEWRFTTKVVPDVTPPVITYTSPGTVAKGFSSANQSLTVTDNKGVSTVVVHIRNISGSSFTDISATPGGTADTYAVNLSEATHFDAEGTEFYITATDLAGNTVRSPADPGTYKVYLVYNAAQSAIPVSNLGIGGTATSWKVITIPFELGSNNGVGLIFNEFSALTNKVDYRLITYGTVNKWSEYPDDFPTMSRGVGYFINVKQDPGSIPLFDNLQAPANSRSNLFGVNLKAGWNMIGNPYLTSISWDDVAALNGLTGTDAQLKTFSSGTYSNDQTLAPYEGGFVFMSSAKTISIPFLGQTSSGGRRGVPSLGEDMSAESWALPLVINQGDVSYSLGGIGMAPDADISIDNYDDITPPRFINFLEMNFPHPEHNAGNFTREIVPTQQNYTWEFTVNSNLDGMAELDWNNAPLVSSGKDLFLLDVSTQQLVNMKETGTFRFDPRESSKFRIYYGDNLNIAPERVQLGKAYPNPTSGYTSIPFSLPETGGMNQSVSLQIMDAMGRPVATVKEGQFNPGYYDAAFDAKELMNGFYTYRLSVKNRKGQTMEVNKLIIK